MQDAQFTVRGQQHARDDWGPGWQMGQGMHRVRLRNVEVLDER
jgi:hypothetical protein